MGHVDPHTIKIIPAAAKRFMGAQRYAVVGRVLQDPARFDNKVSGSGARRGRRWDEEKLLSTLLRSGSSSRLGHRASLDVESPPCLPRVPPVAYAVLAELTPGHPLVPGAQDGRDARAPRVGQV